MDTGHIMENIVFFELRRRGYDVSIGKADSKEADFLPPTRRRGGISRWPSP